MVEFTFLYPRYLFFLFAIPLLFFIHFLSLSSKKKVALKFANFDAISRIQGIDFFSKNLVMLFLNLFILFFIIMAVSGLTLHVLKEASSFSFVIAIDNSESMEADDLTPNRLEASKRMAIEFVDIVPFGTPLGVISFSGSSFIESSLTEDREIIKKVIDKIELSSIGGTDLYEAVITSTNMLVGQENKAIILLSDGQINVGSLEDVFDYANDHDVLINTIAIGTKEGGATSIAISKVDEDSLKSVAYNTGGTFFSAVDEESLSESFSNILELTERKVSIPLFSYLLISVVILFVIGFFLSNTRYLNLP